jgi:anti-sigma B factor antagonist
MGAESVDDTGSATVFLLPSRRAPHVAPGVSVRQRRLGPWMVVVIAGEMDIQVLDLMPDRRTVEASRVVLDLRRVTFMNASGLSALLLCQRQAAAAGGCVRLLAPSTAVRRLLMMTGTNAVFATFWTLDAALSAPVLRSPEQVS